MATHTLTRSTLGNSPLSTLASRTTSEAVTAPDNAHLETKAFTGQYFLERFVTDKEEISKMTVIKMAVKGCDVATLKKSLDDMVEMSGKIDIKNGIDEKKVSTLGATWKTAANHRAVIQKVYGALRFANDAFIALGYKDDMGYHAASTLAKKALDSLTIKWDGTKAKTKDQKDSEAHFRLEKKALKEIQDAVPPLQNESLLAYNQRTLGMVADKIEAMKKDEFTATVEAEVSAILELGHDVALTIVAALQERLTKAVTETI